MFSPNSLSVSTPSLTAVVACWATSFATRVTRASGEPFPAGALDALDADLAGDFFDDAARFDVAPRLVDVDRLDDADRLADADRLIAGRRLRTDFFAPDFFALDFAPRRPPARFAPDFLRDFFARDAMCLPSQSVVMIATDDSRNWTPR